MSATLADTHKILTSVATAARPITSRLTLIPTQRSGDPTNPLADVIGDVNGTSSVDGYGRRKVELGRGTDTVNEPNARASEVLTTPAAVTLRIR